MAAFTHPQRQNPPSHMVIDLGGLRGAKILGGGERNPWLTPPLKALTLPSAPAGLPPPMAKSAPRCGAKPPPCGWVMQSSVYPLWGCAVARRQLPAVQPKRYHQ